LNPLSKSETMPAGKLLLPQRVWRSNGTGSGASLEGGTMSDELLNLDLLKNEELDVEGHAKGSAEDKGDDEVEAHLLNENLLNENLLRDDSLLD
jgi:hypothetical protein